MFDETDGGGDASTGDTGASGTAAEPTVVYGKGDDAGDASQVGSDGISEEDSEESFESLIKGKYKEQYGQKVQETLAQRFKNQEDINKQLNAYRDATAPLFMKYGVGNGDIEALAKAISNDDGLYASEAEEQGLTAEQYRENLKLKMEAEKGRTFMDEYNREQQKKATFARWESESEKLAEAFPAFDLNNELTDKDFVETLNRVGSVREAFLITHLSDILSGAMAQADTSAMQRAADNINQRAARPPENGASGQPAVVRKDNPENWTDEDIDKVIERVKRGETIKL